MFRVEAGSKRRCASLRGGRLRPAQPYGSQEHCQFVFGRSQRRTNIKAEAASKRRCASPPHPGAAGRPLTREPSYSLSPQIPARAQPKACPSSPPRVRLTAAPLSLRRVFARLARFIHIRLPPKSLNRFFRRGARGYFEVIKAARRGANASAGRAHPSGDLMAASTPVLCPRAGGNLIQTHHTRLNDFLLQQSRAVEL